MLKQLAVVAGAGILLSACSMPMMGSNEASPSPTPEMMEESMTNDETSMNMQGEDSMAMNDGVMVGGAMMTRDKDIVENAMNSKDHTTVVAAVKAAGLVETLQGDGPFTVFAPTNAAFNKLPAGTVDKVMMPENKAQLTSILTYHVVPGRYTSADLKNNMTLKTVQGDTITITEKNGQWYANNAMITIADAMSSNGVTHVIDTVLMPK